MKDKKTNKPEKRGKKIDPRSYNRKTETFKQSIRRRFLAAFDETMVRLDLTQKDLCERLGLLPQNITNMRNADRYPTIENLVALCDTFDYDLEYMIRGEVKAGRRRPAPGATLEMVFQELQDLKEVQDKLITNLIDAMIVLKKSNSPEGPELWEKLFKKS